MMNIFKTITNLLLFESTREEMINFKRSHFIAGLIGTWIVGMGRYWDDPEASLLQHLGLGSVIYIFLLAAFIWLILLPFKIEKWRYFTVVTFIGLTSFPAVFYAIPVERFFDMETATSMNAWFLGIVAAWRLALLFFFLKRFTQLEIWKIITVTLMPICLIISTLTVLNLHRVVFAVMGGFREANSYDDAYTVLVILTGVSMILTIPLLMAYITAIVQSRK